MTNGTLVQSFSRSVKLALKAKPISEFAEEVLGDALTAEEAPQDFPALPKKLSITDAVRKALRALPGSFGEVHPEQRRALDVAEVEKIGKEYENLQTVLKLLTQREKDIKEIMRTHQDVVAEQEGRAFPKTVKRNGNVVAEATPRTPDGHYLLAAPQAPEVTEIPGSTAKFSNQYTSGKVTTDLERLTADYEAGELDPGVYRAITVVRRSVDAERLKDFVLKTGNTELMARVTRKGRPSQSMFLRGLTKQ